ncbi:MAG: hypothetical protein FWD96_02865 [Defluviitaleaceae bacterium]|nr:hypothetical protein [Defluviitaleaceae bacterium]
MNDQQRAGISQPYGFETYGRGGVVYYGGSQMWYSRFWQRRAGCGPTSASNIFAHLARQHANLAPLCPYDTRCKDQMLLLMQDVWRYITPTWRGVNTCKLFANGAVRYAAERGVAITPRVLEISAEAAARADSSAVVDFISKAFADDLPVAFLNLCNGALCNLDRWHWVTLIDFDIFTNIATMCDLGNKIEIDLGLWLRTTTQGGGFVALDWS